MASFTGFLLETNLESGFSPDTAVRQTFYDSIDYSNTGSGHLASQTLLGGPLTDNGIQGFPVAHTGSFCPAYGDIFYNRIQVNPSPLDVGPIVEEKVFTIQVFNGFFTSRTLEDIVETNVAGIVLTGAARPIVLSGLQEIEYTVTVAPDVGPATIEGSYFFDFDTADQDQTILVIGARVLALPYLFQAGLSESLNWLTQVITSNDGSEQRVKLRNAPRQEFDFNIAIPNGLVAELDSLLYGWRGNSFGLPISSEGRFSTSPTSTSSPNIDVNTDYADFRVGGLAVIYNSPTDFEIISILSFTVNQIVATANLGKVFGLGALVMPMQVARLLANPTRQTDGERQRLNARFQVLDNIKLATVAAPDQYKGLDIYLEQPLTIGDYLRDTYTTRVDVIDFDTGVAETFAPWKKTKTHRVLGIQLDSLEEIWNFRLWLHRREGKSRPFWMPTFEVNFTLLTTGALDTELLVVNNGQKGVSDERDDIAIKTTTEWAFREISSIVAQGDDLLMTLTATLGFDASTVEYISFMGRKRLASDRLEISWRGNNTASSAVPIIEINN